MANWAEQHGNNIAKYAIALSEVGRFLPMTIKLTVFQLNPIAKAAVGVVNASFEVIILSNTWRCFIAYISVD